MAKLNSLSEGSVASSDKVARSVLRSPVKGTVKRLLVTTVGGSSSRGRMSSRSCRWKTTCCSKRRSSRATSPSLRPGQKTVVKFTAYDFSIYGGLDGVLRTHRCRHRHRRGQRLLHRPRAHRTGGTMDTRTCRSFPRHDCRSISSPAKEERADLPAEARPVPGARASASAKSWQSSSSSRRRPAARYLARRISDRTRTAPSPTSLPIPFPAERPWSGCWWRQVREPSG